MTPTSPESAHAARLDRGGLLPEWAKLERRYIMACESARVGRAHVKVPRQILRAEQAREENRVNGPQKRPRRPVVSDRGEWYVSARAAAKALGVSRTSVYGAMARGGIAAGRTWRYATKGQR